MIKNIQTGLIDFIADRYVVLDEIAILACIDCLPLQTLQMINTEILEMNQYCITELSNRFLSSMQSVEALDHDIAGSPCAWLVSYARNKA